MNKTKKQVISLRINPQILKLAKAVAEQENTTVSDVICSSLWYDLPQRFKENLAVGMRLKNLADIKSDSGSE